MIPPADRAGDTPGKGGFCLPVMSGKRTGPCPQDLNHIAVLPDAMTAEAGLQSQAPEGQYYSAV